MFKKYFIVVVVGLLFFNVASAQTVAPAEQDLLTIIKQLQTQIQALQTQVVDLKTEIQSVKLELKFNRALAQGATGDDVKQLQEFLKTFTGSYPDGSITGYYGPRTEAAVKRFQEQNGIEPVGIVGPKTQEKLNMLVTAIPGTPSVPAPGTVIPAAPTTVFAGLRVSLASNNPTAAVLISPATAAAASVPVLAVNLTAGNSSAMIVSKLKFHENGWFPDSSISDVYLVENGKILYKYSSISGGVIDFSGLSLSVAAGQTRTIWLVIDITSNLSVGNNVSFGLNAASDVTARDALNNSVAAISGSFPMVGNWFMARSASNLSPAPAPPVTTPSAVLATPAQPIGQTTTQPATPCKTPIGTQIRSDAITVLSPNGGEQWQIGGTYTIKYSAKDIVGNKALLIYLEKGYDAPTTKTGMNSGLLIGVTTNLESYTYTVPQSIQSWPGFGSNYKITIMVEGSFSSCGVISYDGDSSDAEFSIVAGQNNVPPATSAGPTIPGGTTTIMPAGGGGYGVSAVPVSATQNILITQDKIARIQARISALQNQLNTTTDDATRASLKAQIAALQTVIQELQNQIFQGQLLPTSVPAPIQDASFPTTTPQATPTTQDQIAALSKQVSSLQNQLNITTDDATRTSLMTQIVALRAQMQALQNTLPTTQSSGSTMTPTVQVQLAPSINVTFPNGGEILTIGKMYKIKWTGGNNAVDVWLLDNPTRLGKKIFSGITNSNYVSWVATPFSSSDLWNEMKGTFAVPSGQYVIWVGCTDNNCTVDDSDSYFKIVE